MLCSAEWVQFILRARVCVICCVSRIIHNRRSSSDKQQGVVIVCLVAITSSESSSLTISFSDAEDNVSGQHMSIVKSRRPINPARKAFNNSNQFRLMAKLREHKSERVIKMLLESDFLSRSNVSGSEWRELNSYFELSQRQQYNSVKFLKIFYRDVSCSMLTCCCSAPV